MKPSISDLMEQFIYMYCTALFSVFKCNRAHERKIWMYEDADLLELHFDQKKKTVCDWNKFINEAENIDVAIY